MIANKRSKPLFGLLWLILCCPAQASFIETTMGTAIVNDATAAYFNPAALVLLKNPQLIPLATVTRFRTQFSGQTTTVATGFTETGTANTTSYFQSPSFYFGMPVNNKIILGFAAVTNFANRNPEENAILRYVQSSNTIQDYDFVPSIGFNINDYFSLGTGINFSYTNFHLRPTIGFPGSNIADIQSNNRTNGSGISANAGFLFRPRTGTLIGFNYRALTTYNESGSSSLSGGAQITSTNYRYYLRTPARSILSIGQMLTPTMGVITTIQRIQWGKIRNMHVYNLATSVGSTPIITDATIPYYLHNTWMLTLGGNYRVQPHWIVRIAATYHQSPDGGHYQISNGDSYILGTSVGYQINKTIAVDGSYAHAFMQTQPITIVGNRYLVNGNNQGNRDVVSLKLTVNV